MVKVDDRACLLWLAILLLYARSDPRRIHACSACGALPHRASPESAHLTSESTSRHGNQAGAYVTGGQSNRKQQARKTKGAVDVYHRTTPLKSS